jgi:hypothetical protein
MSSAQASAALPQHARSTSRAASVTAAFVAPATMIVILAISLLLLMTPLWMHSALTAAWASGGDVSYGLGLSDGTVREIFFGPGTFSAFSADEAAHMRDVRVVFWGFMALAIASLAFVVWRVARHGAEAHTWRSMARGGIVLAVALVVGGIIAFIAFDAAFELFHRIFFPGGNWAFPADSLLIRLYPYPFWQLSAGALGALGIAGGLTVWLLASRRARTLERTLERG